MVSWILRSRPGRKKKQEDTLGEQDDPPNEADDGLPSERDGPLSGTHDMTDVFSNVDGPLSGDAYSVVSDIHLGQA